MPIHVSMAKLKLWHRCEAGEKVSSLHGCCRSPLPNVQPTAGKWRCLSRGDLLSVCGPQLHRPTLRPTRLAPDLESLSASHDEATSKAVLSHTGRLHLPHAEPQPSKSASVTSCSFDALSPDDVSRQRLFWATDHGRAPSLHLVPQASQVKRSSF